MADQCAWYLVYRCSITDFSPDLFSNTATISWTEPDGTTISATDTSYFANVDAGGAIRGLPRGVLQLTKGIRGTGRTDCAGAQTYDAVFQLNSPSAKEKQHT